MQKAVAHPAFDLFISLVVFTNAIFIGFEVQSDMRGQWMSEDTARTFNYTFAAIFTWELIARLIADGVKKYFTSDDSWWNYLDVVIVITSTSEIIIDIISQVEGGRQNTISGLKVFRILRLTKIVKTVRLVRILRFVLALRTLVTSIAHTLKALFWALTLLALIIYVPWLWLTRKVILLGIANTY